MRRPKTYIIDQEQHLENLRKIIKRDFFGKSGKEVKQQHKGQQPIPMRLNDYIKNFKSTENHVFAELVQGDAENWKKKHEWMEKSKYMMLESGQSKPFTNMISKGEQLKALNYGVVQQEPKNAIFFSPTRETKSYNSSDHEKAKHILYDNCRIQTEELRRAQIYEAKNLIDPNLQEIPSTPVLEGRLAQKKIRGSQQQYSMKRAPSPQPQKLPIMTWGQVQQTPLRLTANDDEEEYRIPEQPARDKLLDQLASKLAKQKMIKKNKKDDLKFKIMSSVRAGGSSYRKVSIARESSYKREAKKQDG